MFLFRSDKNSGCYGNLKFPYTNSGKSVNLQFFSVSKEIFGFILQRCLLSSPIRFI